MRVDRLFMVGGTSSLFTTLGVKPLLGRLPGKDDDAQRASVMVISHALWTTGSRQTRRSSAVRSRPPVPSAPLSG